SCSAVEIRDVVHDVLGNAVRACCVKSGSVQERAMPVWPGQPTNITIVGCFPTVLRGSVLLSSGLVYKEPALLVGCESVIRIRGQYLPDCRQYFRAAQYHEIGAVQFDQPRSGNDLVSAVKTVSF